MASIGDVSRRVLRPWPTTIVATGSAATALIIAVRALLDGGATLGYAIMGGVAVTALRRSTRLGVAVDGTGLRMLRFGPAKVVPWTAIEDIDCDLIAIHGLFGFYAPILTVAGAQVNVRALGSYRRELAEQRTRDLRSAAAHAPGARLTSVR